MSNERISIQDVVDQISQQTGRTKKSVEEFIRTMFLLIEEGLITDKIVKIKGLGTFKLIWNESRKSVNVQTGEEFEIPGHNKVSFTPDANLKDIINQPYAHLSPIDLDNPDAKPVNPLDKLNEQAEEIKGIISEINTISKKKKTDETVVSNKEQKSEQETILEPENISVDSEEVVIEVPPTKEKKKRIGCLIPILLGVVIIGIVAYYYYQKTIKEKSVEDVQPTFVSSDAVLHEEKDTTTIVSDTADTVIQVIEEKKFSEILKKPRIYNSILTVETSEEGTRLTILSRRYYGHKDFWVYIYEANKNKITNPDIIPVGIDLIIPIMNPKLIDVKNPECLEYAKKLHDLYIIKK